jgi:hypothetical protein
MAHALHYSVIRKGTGYWNHWRYENRTISRTLVADVRDLSAYSLEPDLTGVDLTGEDLSGIDFSQVNLAGANLSFTNLREANLRRANLRSANLTGANLKFAIIAESDLQEAVLKATRVYGIAAWNVRLSACDQRDLIVSDDHEPLLTVDHLEIAQFLYLLINNSKLRDVIDSIASKVVLILGRFAPGRKPVLDALRENLRRRNKVPVLFDFEPPGTRNLTETVSTLAHLAQFVIADLTEPRCVPQELMAIVSKLPHVPVQPLIQSAFQEYSMFEDFRYYPWVLPIRRYASQAELLNSLDQIVTSVEEVVRKQAEA